MMASDARKRLAERTAERLTVQVTVDTDELREWADRHADMGNHGVAHVLYAAAKDGETLTEQAIREAEKRGAIEALRIARLVESDMSECASKAWRSAGARRGLSDHEALLMNAFSLTRWSERLRMAFDGEDYRADRIAADAQGGDQ